MSAEEKLRFKFNKKLKIAVGNSKFSNSGRKKAEDNVNDSENGKRENYRSSVRDKKFHTAEEGSRGAFDRRKRTYIERDAAWEANSNEEAPYRKVLSKKGQNQLKYGYINEKNYSRSPSRPRYKWGSNESDSAAKRFSPRERSAKVYNNFGDEKNNSRFPSRPRSKWGSDRLENASETKRFSPKVRSAKVFNDRKVKEADDFGNEKRSPSHPRTTWGSDTTASDTKRFSPKVRSEKRSNKTKVKDVDEIESVTSDGGLSASLKKQNQIKPDLRKSPNISLPNTVKKKACDKNILDEGSEVLDGQHKKKKRMRLDPHDISNKRLDDSIATNGQSFYQYLLYDRKVKEADDFGNEKRSPSHPRTTWGSDTTASDTKRFSPKVRSEKRSNKTKVKDVDEIESVTSDGGLSASLKKQNQIKPDLRKSPNISLPNTVKKKACDKNILDEGSEVLDGQHKKKKRMRLDPHDISNKRLDDSIATNGQSFYQYLLYDRKVKEADDFGNEKRSPSHPRTTWGSDTTASDTKRFSPKVRSEKRSNKTKVKDVDEIESVTSDGGLSASLKKQNQIKPDLRKSPNISLPNTVKKKACDKNILDEGSEVLDGQHKKKKRMRLDPHDISNKRLDDSIATNEKLKENDKDVEEKAEISKNAQFRAIQPSPSILSYVEDNLLGRRRLIELRRAGYNTEISAPLDNTPFSTSSDRERIEENIFRSKLTFFAAAKVSSSFPPPDLPEIAFAGRSNVGKSSLLNALTRNWGVARTSDKPGLTQTINFFNLGSKLCLVDLPGYGFAYAKEEVKDAWEELVKEYVSTRVGLKRVCLLIDTKWGMKPRDRELIDLMERSQTKYQILLTKSDAVFPIDVARRAMQIEESLKANKSVVQPVLMMSSRTGAGIRSLRTVLAKIARVAKI